MYTQRKATRGEVQGRSGVNLEARNWPRGLGRPHDKRGGQERICSHFPQPIGGWEWVHDKNFIDQEFFSVNRH
jgi:hypothetical protein